MKTPICLGQALILTVSLSFLGCSDPSSTASTPGEEKQARNTQSTSEASLSTSKPHAHADHSDADTCTAHGIPRNLCLACNPDLREKGRLWCGEHGRYEDRCWICHPELQDPERLYCKEHHLYEDECFICHPETVPPPQQVKAGKKSAAASKESNRLFCKEHQVYEDECAICHPEFATNLQRGQSLKIRLPSPAAAEKAGIQTGHAGMSNHVAQVESFAELTFNQNQFAAITPLVEGVVQSIHVDLGDNVAEGDPLATIASLQIAEAQSDLLKATSRLQLERTNRDREQALFEKEISALKELQEAEAAFASAEANYHQAHQKLLALGFSKEEIAGLQQSRTSNGHLTLRAPFRGQIVERHAVKGEQASPGKALFKVADLSRMWAMLKIPEAFLVHLEKGQAVEVRIHSIPNEIFQGTLTWVDAQVDPRTRMARARVEIPNPEGRLKASMFAQATILTDRSRESLMLPSNAIQSISGNTFAFVQLEPDLFEARLVRISARHQDTAFVSGVLAPEDAVVLEGSFSLKSQFLLSRLGAGCVHE